MGNVSFAQIDRFFVPWAEGHGLAVYTQAKDEETRAVVRLDDEGNEFEIWAIPEFRPGFSEVSVGAALRLRGNKKHTFFRERKNYYYCISVSLNETVNALGEAWRVVLLWEQALKEGGNA
jgi:hypothetical protein